MQIFLTPFYIADSSWNSTYLLCTSILDICPRTQGHDIKALTAFFCKGGPRRDRGVLALAIVFGKQLRSESRTAWWTGFVVLKERRRGEKNHMEDRALHFERETQGRCHISTSLGSFW